MTHALFNGRTLFILILLLCSCVPLQACAAGNRRFSIRLEQNGADVPINAFEAHMKKQPFTVIISFLRPAAPEILVNASFTDQSFKAAKEGLPLHQIEGFSETAMADYLLNPMGWLMISRTAPAYFYYTSPCDHRYNLVKDDEGKRECTRNVSVFMYRDQDSSVKPIEEADCRELYLVFMQTQWNADTTAQKEFCRDFVRITFDR